MDFLVCLCLMIDFCLIITTFFIIIFSLFVITLNVLLAQDFHLVCFRL